ncbi:MAG: hypothetical protein POELPBGB_00377 [Bacteroidia bacterium]|nr:hypothetical protein [Bacteroidia bacterium]
MKIIPRLFLKLMNYEVFDEFVKFIITMLTGNVNFPVTNPTLADVQTKSDAYHAIVIICKDGNGNKVQRQQRKQLRDELHTMITDLAYDVATRSLGDLAIYLTSGFDYKRPRVPAGDLTAPGNNRLAYTENSGELVNRHNKVNGALLYVVMVGITAVPPEVSATAMLASGPAPGPTPGQDWWIAGVSSSTKFTITGLTPGTMYYTRCLAIGSGGDKIGPWSSVVGKMAV